MAAHYMLLAVMVGAVDLRAQMMLVGVEVEAALFMFSISLF
jgi:hypothetical protein